MCVVHPGRGDAGGCDEGIEGLIAEFVSEEGGQVRVGGEEVVVEKIGGIGGECLVVGLMRARRGEPLPF